MVVVLSGLEGLAPESFGRLRMRFPNDAHANGCWRGGGRSSPKFYSGPADLLAGSNPPTSAKELVVGLGDAPSDACMSGR